MPLIIVRENIVNMRVDAIVNTTNEEMVGYSGVDLAVHNAAGEELRHECARLAPLGQGMAVMTGGYRLPAKHIIHTSGPVYRDGLHGESVLLRSCYLECLKLATAHGIQSVAFPLISSGAYGYPKDQVLHFAVETISEYLETNELLVYLCVYDRESYAFSKELYEEITAFLTDESAEDGYLEREPCRPDRRRILEKRAPMAKGMRDDACLDGEDTFFEATFSCADEGEVVPPARSGSAIGKTLQEYMRQRDSSFSEMLFAYIDERGMSDVECYKRANVDKRIFSKIRSHKSYRPSKPTAIAFAISLRLDLEETQELLASAGYTLSRSFVFDKIIRYFIQNGKYDIFEINEALFEFDQTPLGAF